MKTLQLTALTITFLLAFLPAASSAAPFTLSVDGSEVIDQGTGLIWRRCTEGMLWKGATCINDITACTHANTAIPATFTHEEALSCAEKISATTGQLWRLPNIKELSSIVDITLSPAIDANFPATPIDRVFWSASPYVGNAAVAWVVYFSYGNVYYSLSRAIPGYVRLVRAGQ